MKSILRDVSAFLIVGIIFAGTAAIADKTEVRDCAKCMQECSKATKEAPYPDQIHVRTCTEVCKDECEIEK